MKANIEERIYIIVAIDSIINGNVSNTIDLGRYQIEYLVKLEDRTTLMIEEGGIPSIKFMVKVRNKDSKKLEWAEAYYKALKKYYNTNLFELSLEEKKDFIFRKETLFLKRKFSTSVTLVPSNFWNELEDELDQYDYPRTIMPRNLSEEGKKEIIDYSNYLINELEQIKVRK